MRASEPQPTRPPGRQTTARARALAAVVVVATSVAPTLSTGPAQAQSGDGCENVANAQECVVDIAIPGHTIDLGPLPVPPPEGNGDGGDDPCTYTSVAERPQGGNHSPNAVPYLKVCPLDDGRSQAAIVVWFEPGEEPWSGLAVTSVRDALWSRVEARLVPPQIQTQPPGDLPSIVNLPTFVTIANPQPATRYIGRANGIEVWIDVWPTVTLHPGEPDAPAIACDHDGTTYDPTGAEPAVQADGACAHTYRHRSAEGWPGDVTITWHVTWDSTVVGQQGTLTAAPSTTAFVRVVSEVSSVVTDAGD
jgi:hypothetical protein